MWIFYMEKYFIRSFELLYAGFISLLSLFDISYKNYKRSYLPKTIIFALHYILIKIMRKSHFFNYQCIYRAEVFFTFGTVGGFSFDHFLVFH